MKKLDIYFTNPKDPGCEEVYVKGFKEFTGYIMESDGDLDFTINVAPGISEGPQGVNYLLLGLKEDIRFLNSFKRFVHKIADHVVDIDGDFYWREGDLNIRISLKMDNIVIHKPKNWVP